MLLEQGLAGPHRMVSAFAAAQPWHAPVPAAWVVRQAKADGSFLPWEKSVLLAAFVVPQFARPVATCLALPIGPAITASLFFIVLRRAAMRQEATP